jgi:hypothetical protein
METVATFIARNNVKLFRNQLEHDVQNGAYNDGQRHAILLKLLVEAENILGHSREQLNDVERQIASIKSIINKQLDTIAMLKTNGHPVEHAERVLAHATDFLSVHETQREMIAAALNPGDTRQPPP